MIALPDIYDGLQERLDESAPAWSSRLLPVWESPAAAEADGASGAASGPGHEGSSYGFAAELTIGGTTRTAQALWIPGGEATVYQRALFAAARRFGIGKGLGEHLPFRVSADPALVTPQAISELTRRGAIAP